MASRLQDVIARGLAADKPVATDVAPGTLYFSTDTSVLERSNGTIWETYSIASGGLPGAHATTHIVGGTDPIIGALELGTDAYLTVTGANSYLESEGGIWLTNGGGIFGGSVNGRIQISDYTYSDPVAVSLELGGGTASSPSHVLLKRPGGLAELHVRIADESAFAVLRAKLDAGDLVTGTIDAARLPAGTGVTRRQVALLIDGGTAVITTGVKGYVSLPVDGTWKKWRILSTDGLSGSITVDIWKAAYASYPPVVANTIVASDKPMVSAAIKNEGTALTGWTNTFAAGDILGFNVDTVTSLKKVSLTLEFE